MKFLLRFHRHLPWFNFPVAALAALLQRTPVLRVAATAETAIIGSPMGQALRSAVTAVASLGAVHALAGATQFVVNPTSNVSGTVGTPVQTVAFTVTGALTPAGSYRITSLPPGVTVPGANASGVINGTSGVISGTPTTAGTYRTSILAYEFNNATGDTFGPVTITYTIAGSGPITPAFTLQPASQTVSVGTTVTFTATASGTPAPTYQWNKNGAAIDGATSPTLTLIEVQPTAAGTYTVAATNTAGSATSNPVTLTVNAAPVTPPVFTTQPTSLTVAAGSTTVLSSVATAANSYRWQRNGADVAGATFANLVLKGVTAADAASYQVIATNTAGSTTSNTVTLTVAAIAATDLARLVNVSILNNAGPDAKVLTVGAVVGPLNVPGTLPLVVRAVGPTLTTFGLGGVLADPVLTLNAAGITGPIAINDNWGSGAALSTAFQEVGAFVLPAGSLDSATLADSTPGSYTVQVTGKGTATGLVIAEIYDHSTARTATSPRLINLSSLTQIDAGTTLAVGFVLRGSGARTVLVRGIGPSLATLFNLGGVMADPKLELFNNDTGAKLTENDNWGGDAQLRDANAATGAFAIADGSSKDAILLMTLPPGAYSARVSGVGTSAGTAIVEVYELP